MNGDWIHADTIFESKVKIARSLYEQVLFSGGVLSTMQQIREINAAMDEAIETGNAVGLTEKEVVDKVLK